MSLAQGNKHTDPAEDKNNFVPTVGYTCLYAYWRKTSQIRNRVSLILMSVDVKTIQMYHV